MAYNTEKLAWLIQAQEETHILAIEFDDCSARFTAGRERQNKKKIFVFFEAYRGCTIHVKRNMNYLLVNFNGNIQCHDLWVP
jgi:hypothetical protein